MGLILADPPPPGTARSSRDGDLRADRVSSLVHHERSASKQVRMAACAGMGMTESNPTTIDRGPRIGATAQLRVGASAAVVDGDRILLTRRSDNGQWCLPGGGMDAGESAAETAVREVFEETGLTIRITGLLGVYSDPDLVVTYPDGNRAHIVASCFWAEIAAGTPGPSDEVTDFGWFTAEQADSLDVVETQHGVLAAAFGRRPAPFYDEPRSD
jgi:8-oxo-dGTP pyrophosphatase MutT (NUDIX family)